MFKKSSFAQFTISLILFHILTVSLAEDPIPGSYPFMFGAFTYGGVWQGMDAVHELEATLGRDLDIVHWFMNWSHHWDANLLNTASQKGRLPMISWQPHTQGVEAIARGDYDDYMRTWAQGVKNHDGLVYLRPFPEMNGDWVGWNGNPEAMVLAWQRMVELFANEGADNVRWVWSPNITDWPRTEANKMENYYPGSDYVDILALDGYNWGTVREWSSWRSFEDIFTAPYERIIALGDQPVWLAEIGSTEEGGDKAAWIRDMFNTFSLPRIEAVIWFDEHKEADWRIRSSSSAVAAFQDSLLILEASAQR